MSLDLPIRFKHTDAASEGLSNKDLELGPEFSEVELFYSEEPFEIVLAFMVIEESELMQAAANSFFRDEEQMKSTLFYYLEEGVAREGFAVTNAKVDITYPNIGELTVLGSANAVCNGFYLGVDMLAFKNDEVYVFVYEYYYKEHLPLLPCLTGINQRIEAFRKS